MLVTNLPHKVCHKGIYFNTNVKKTNQRTESFNFDIQLFRSKHSETSAP